MIEKTGEISETKLICVYCSSSDAISPDFFDIADELGALIAGSGYGLIYGGGNIGLMGRIAKSVHRHAGHVVGVIPKFMHERKLTYELVDELVLTDTMRERKAEMEARADAFIGLPGGFGTLEEMLEVLTLKQLGRHNKPIVFVNARNFYNGLEEVFEHIYRERFARPDYRSLYHFAPDAVSAIAYIENYQPLALNSKWLWKTEH